ncbi:class I SAM-dependent methyltransferase [Roseateles sp.]|uniref:class I SAM-dependent methyltransferase n=1 Tax=Roseateles sp. TaxID=1971397 RepID=UPI0031DEC91B
MSNQQYVDMARDAWNEVAPIHWQHTEQLIDKFKDPATSFLTPVFAAELQRLGVQGKRIAQLNCNNGRELISILRLGAASGTGFDISEEFISQARKLASSAEVNASFVATDVYQIAPEFNERFDLVVVTSGALCFMPDSAAYIAVAARILKAGGHLAIYDCHPITDLFELDRDRGDKPVEFVRSYFDSTPVSHTTGLDYVGSTTYEASEIFYFHHTLGDIIQACLAAGLAIEHFDETAEDPSGAFPRLARSKIVPPLSFLLTARKEPA